MKAGFFTTDISLPIGYNISGGYTRNLSNRAYDALKIRAAVFSDGKIKTAIASVDSCGINARFIEEALEEVKNLAGITFDAHIIAATHVHTGGYLSRGQDALIEACRKFLPGELFKRLDPESLPVPDEPYYQYCKSQLATALIEAFLRMEEAEISTGKGSDCGRIFNRRTKMKNGRTYTHGGKGNPDLVDYAGPVDPELNVLGAWRKDGSLIGCILNYACHGTCMCSYSGSHGDWFLYTDRLIKKLVSENAGVVIMNGACGDVTQVDNFSAGKDFGVKVAKELGERVGAEAYKVLLGAHPRPDATLKTAHEVLPIAKRHPSPARFAEAVEIIKKGDPKVDDEAMFARGIIETEVMFRNEPVSKQDITSIQIGEAVFISNQNELFTELGLKIKKESPFRYTFVCTMANGTCVYVPTLAAFDPVTGGGYETRLFPGKLDIHAGDMMVEKSIEMIRSFTPDAPVKTPCPPGEPWNYGTNPPQID
ncbi:MAG: hypothetical protein J6A21_05235 [Lentisphaeria bacterium]|nr:hypothetical protein [Lentisphaeria bacterium]